MTEENKIGPDVLILRPYTEARQIVCEEWQKAVIEFGLCPGSVTEKVVSRIVDRLDTVPPLITNKEI